jgi:hypothetical protein
MNRAVPAGAFLDGAGCIMSMVFAPAVRAMGPSPALDDLRPALAAIGAAAEAARAAAAARLVPVPSGWLSTAAAARVWG